MLVRDKCVDSLLMWKDVKCFVGLDDMRASFSNYNERFLCSLSIINVSLHVWLKKNSVLWHRLRIDHSKVESIVWASKNCYNSKKHVMCLKVTLKSDQDKTNNSKMESKIYTMKPNIMLILPFFENNREWVMKITP